MALTEEELYLEQLWKEDHEEDEEVPALQQELAKHESFPSYNELMGREAAAISLRPGRKAAAEPQTLAPTGPSYHNPVPSTGGDGSPGNSSTRPAWPPLQPTSSPALPADLASGPSVGADTEQLKRRLQSVVQTVNAHQKRYELVLLEANKATDLVRSMEAEISSLQREAEELSRRVPPAPERQRQVDAWLQQRRAAMEAQREVHSSRQLELIAAEAALRAAERELDFLAEAREQLEAAKASERADAASSAAALRAREERAVAGYRRKQAAETARLEAVKQEAEEEAQRRVQAADEARSKVLARLRSNTERIREGMAAGREALAAEQGRRREAVVGLKASLAAVRADVARQAELAAVLQRQRRELQEREFGALVESGMNPYEVFRRRDQQEETHRHHAAIQDNIAARQLELAAQLAREQEAYQRALAARKREKEHRETFDREMGVAARHARTDAYMKAHTAAGTTMLDPTGRLPVHPSQVTVVKDARFGHGGARPEVLAQQLARLGPEVPKALLLPAKYLNMDVEGVAGLPGHARGSDDEGEGMGSPPRSPRPLPPPAASQPSNQSGVSQAGSKGGKSDQADRYKQLATRPLTKLEQSIMEQAKERHKQAIGIAQTQMGRSFGGDAFMASPAVIEFKDYDMGCTTTTSVQIINRSYKKNTFRVLGIPVEHCDVLDFSYKLPGYLAPGVSGEVTVSFKPKDPVDIDTCLQLLCDTGPFEVPIRCRTKRAALSVSATALDFGAGVTLGDSASRTFVISNDGALEVEYRLDSPQLSDDERALLKSSNNLNHLLASTTVAAAAAAATAGPTPGGGTLSRARSFASLAAGDTLGGAAGVGVGDSAPPVVAPREERRLSHDSFTVFPCVGLLQGYSKVTFTVTFAPVVAAPAKLVLHASYKAPSMKRLSLPQHEVVVTGVGRDVPVYLERPIIDFQCCLFGHTYRDVLQVRNGGKTAMKVTVVPRPELEGFFEFSPEFGFVQAGDSFPVTIRFKPTPALLTACRKHLVEPEEEQVVEVPMRLSVPDQTLPVHFTLRAQVTITDLLFDPPSLDFGDCVMTERTAVRLNIRNPGRLPQTFGFVGLPSGLRISPNDGFGYVLPGESLERLVSFQPAIAGPQSFSIAAKTLAGRTFTLQCRACGVQPRLSLSHNRIRMPVAAVGDTRTVSVVLINRTDAPQAYEFAVPPLSDLTFSPHVAKVPPQSRLRVQIDYSPRPPEDGEQPGTLAPPSAAGSMYGTADGDDESDDGGGGRNTPGSLEWPRLASPAASSPGQGEGGGGGGDEEDGGRGAARPGRSAGGGSGGGGRRGSPEGRRGGGGGRRGSPLAGPRKGKKGSDEEEDEQAEGGAQGEDDDEDGGSISSAVRSQWRRLYGASSEWYRHRTHTITCYIQPQQQQLQPARPPAGGAAGDGVAPATAVQELHLELSTCATLPDLVLHTPLPYVAVHQCHCLDFGPVPVGQRVVRSLEVANEGSEPMSLAAEALDTREVFSCVNALRPVRQGATFRMLVSFTPQARTEYLEMLCVKSARTRLRLVLKGAGIAPELQLEPSGVTSAGLDLGDVLVGESYSRTLTLTNVCPFPLSFALRLRGLPSAADPNPAMRAVFACQPSEGTLAQGERCEVVVSFCPNSQRPYFEDLLQVEVPNQQEQMLVPLRGRGWQEGVFVAGPNYPEPEPDPFLLHQLAAAAKVHLPPSIAGRGGGGGGAAATAGLAAAAGGVGGKPSTASASKPTTPAAKNKAAAAAAATAAAAAAAAGPVEQRTLTLTFPDAVYCGEVAKASFEVGSLRSTVHGSAPGEIVLHELPAEAREAGWALVEPSAPSGGGPAKLAIGAGELKSVVLSYTAPPQPHPGMVAAYGHAEYRTLRLQCTLKGGLAALSGGPDGRPVIILARCKLLSGGRPAEEPLPPSVATAPAAGAGKKAPPPSAG